ncbi:MAG: hypothetical protein HC783_17835 [Rhodobacteraceae bacterium]|nr:hypothetical protein [Paracoccaceae bacterium]
MKEILAKILSMSEFKPSSLADWAKAAAKSAPAGDVNALNWQTPDGISVKSLYTAEDVKELPHTNTLPVPLALYPVRPMSSVTSSSHANAPV